MTTTRPLSDHERAILLRLVEVQGGPRELIEQVNAAEFGQPWFEGSQSFSIVIPLDMPKYAGGMRTMNGAATVGHASVYQGGVAIDENYVGGMMLWTQDGLLADLEYSWTTDEMPTSLPPLEDIVG